MLAASTQASISAVHRNDGTTRIDSKMNNNAKIEASNYSPKGESPDTPGSDNPYTDSGKIDRLAPYPSVQDS
jgi:hypothetical protein